MSFSRTKVTYTCETPSLDTDRSSSMPLMVLTASSILSVMSVSISSGADPGRRVITAMVGKSTFGNRSTPSWKYPTTPRTRTTRTSTVANTGRRTEMLANHCMANSLHAGAVDDGLVGSGHDAFTRTEAFQDCDLVAVRGAGEHHAFLDRTVYDHEGPKRRLDTGQRALRDDGESLLTGAELRLGEHAWHQAPFVVVDDCLDD